jgi:uncharacterized iron-regulated protein
MEFFDYPKQNVVDQYLAGKLDEAQFLKDVNWGGFPFDWYREQVLAPLAVGGTAIALNAPRSLTGRIARVGVKGLDKSEAALLPPQFSVGSDLYFDRFLEVIGATHPGDRQKFENMFAAQSTWDDTMAWRSIEFVDENPDEILVVIVGDFHVAYELGLPARLEARGVQKMLTISQVKVEGLTDDEKSEYLKPDAKYGTRSDYIWISK